MVKDIAALSVSADWLTVRRRILTCTSLKSPKMYGSMLLVSGSRALNLVTLWPASHLYIFWMFLVPPGASLRLRSLCRKHTTHSVQVNAVAGRLGPLTHAAGPGHVHVQAGHEVFRQTVR